MTKKKNDDKKFNLENALLTVHPLMRTGFTVWLKNYKITNQKQFDKAYNLYKEMRANDNK